MEDWQQRAIEEHRDLAEKLGRLVAFISSSPVFDKLSVMDQLLLRDQRDGMVDYHTALSTRISRFLKG